MKTTALVSILGSVLFGLLIGTWDITPKNVSSVSNPIAVPPPKAPLKIGYPSFMSPHASPIAVIGDRVFVVNTPADTVDLIDAATRAILHRVSVGIDPVSIAVRPDEKEVWVANHVSDSVSVIDTDRSSSTYLNIVATIQDIDENSRSTRFDEPVGIAFANNDKAYVALSSENEIAVIDVASRKIKKRLHIASQDPRAITVRGNRLYVIPFESNNKTQLSGGNKDKIDGSLVTFDAWEHSVANNNVLSLGHVVDIVKHPRVPDRDLYVFDTQSDELIDTVDSLGTLLYGLTVDSNGRVYIAQTDARNDINGRAGTKDHGLAELENRAFLNQITTVRFGEGRSEPPQFFDLEQRPPNQMDPDESLATPFAIEISDDDSTLVVAAAGSDKLFTVDTVSGELLGRVAVDAVPRGIALESDTNGKPRRAWVHNAVSNSVSLVDLADRSKPTVVDSVMLHDPTHPAIKRGRIAFNTAMASTTGTFSCASCHPDGHTDQLLWVLKTPVVTRGNQIMPRSTMPVRGLRDTAPFHWDGIPGDPYGGNNSAKVYGHDPPNSDAKDPESTTRHLIDGALASTMNLVGNVEENDEGKIGRLSALERDDMAKFLLYVPYPPAQRRAYTNVLSATAQQGFELFHVNGDDDPTKSEANVCGDCHRMPFLVSTNTPGTGMDAPTWRGAYDRWLILPQGRLNIIDFDFFRRVADDGLDERRIWQFSWAGRRRFDPVWNMVLEASTGFSGSFARQVTVNKSSALDKLTNDMLNALEQSAAEGAVVLQAEGVFLNDGDATPVNLQYDADSEGGAYVEVAGNRNSFAREQLVSRANSGSFVGTFTARHGASANYEHPQPALWTRGPIERQRGHQEFPFVYDGNNRMKLSGRNIDAQAHVIVDGRRVGGRIEIRDESVEIELEKLPGIGMHLLQVQNVDGLFSNDFIFHVSTDVESVAETKRQLDRQRSNPQTVLQRAISAGDLAEVRRLVGQGASVNARHPESGSTPLCDAATVGNCEIAVYLIEQGARVSGANRDNNTPLHIASFFCYFDFVDTILKRGASRTRKNNRGENSIDVVSSKWDEQLAGFYRSFNESLGLNLELAQLKKDRVRMATMLREFKVED